MGKPMTLQKKPERDRSCLRKKRTTTKSTQRGDRAASTEDIHALSLAPAKMVSPESSPAHSLNSICDLKQTPTALSFHKQTPSRLCASVAIGATCSIAQHIEQTCQGGGTHREICTTFHSALRPVPYSFKVGIEKAKRGK